MNLAVQRSWFVLVLLLIPSIEAMATQTYGDWWVRNNPFFIAGTVDNTSTNNGTVATYTDTWNATGVDVIPFGVQHIHDWYEPNQVPWVLWITPGLEGSDGIFQPFEIDVDPNMPYRVGYHIGGEPKNQQEIDEVLATAAALKAYDPNGLVYAGINADPGVLLVQQYMADPNIDLIMGHKYTLNDSYYVDLERYRSFGLEYGKPYWRFLQSFFAPGQGYFFTESDFRFQGFSSLAYGHTGLVWFIYNLKSSSDLTPQMFITTQTQLSIHRRSPQFEDVADLNAEMAIIGNVTRQLRSTDVRLNLGDNNGPIQPGVPDWSAGAGDDPHITSIDQLVNDDMDILTGFFVSADNEIYFMLQNTLHDHGDNPGNTPGTIRVDFDFSSVTDPNFDKSRIRRLSRTTGLWEDVALVSDGGDLYHTDLTLSAGSGDLFRYSTPVLVADFNRDSVINGIDIDLLRSAINTSSADPMFDVNNDSTLDSSDFDHLVQVMLATEFGDADLNQIVNQADIDAMRFNFGDASGWASGNFDLSDLVDANDLALARQNLGFAPAPAPEPTSLGLISCLCLLGHRFER